jgi:small subunit ribosomal protein S20
LTCQRNSYKAARTLNLTKNGGKFLASHKSAEKRIRQGEKRRGRNVSLKSSVKTKIKSVLKAVEAKDAASSKAALAKAIPAIDKACGKGVLHKKTASRKISRLTLKVNHLLK